MAPSSADSLNILVYGAGAVGTYIGGSLARAGHQVLFLERPNAAAELRARGLTLALPDGDYRITSPDVSESLPEALARGPFEAAVFALKSFDTPAAAGTMKDHLQSKKPDPGPAFPPVLCLQNGVENEEVLRQSLGPGTVISGTVTSAIGRSAVGHIRLERLRGVGIAHEHKIAPRLAAAMEAAGLNARLYPDGPPLKWSKLLTNVIANASAAILDMTPTEIFSDSGLFRLELAQLREVLAVMAAQGLSVVDLPGTPTRALALAVRNLPAGVVRPILKRAIGRGRGGKMPSFHIDLHSGRGRTEVDFLNGAVSRFGAHKGVPTPVNSALTEILTKLTQDEFPLRSFHRNPQALLDQIKNLS